jgi:hypothetical protein
MNRANLPLRVSVFKKTRCLHGRRALTPIRHKKKKTRSHHSIGKKTRNVVQLQQHTGTSHVSEWEEQNENQYGQNQEREGNENSGSPGERKDKEVKQDSDYERDTIHPKESVHPGSIQELREVSAESIAEADTQDEEENGLIEHK